MLSPRMLRSPPPVSRKMLVDQIGERFALVCYRDGLVLVFLGFGGFLLSLVGFYLLHLTPHSAPAAANARAWSAVMMVTM